MWLMQPTAKTFWKRPNRLRLIKAFVTVNALLPAEALLAPVMVLYYLNHVGLSFATFGLYIGILMAFQAALEIPMGMVSDFIGRRLALCLGYLLIAVGLGLIALFPAALTLIPAGAIFAIGQSLSTGNLTSIAYEVFKANDMESKFKPFLVRASSLVIAAMAGGALVGGYIAQIDIALPMIADVAILAAKALLAFSLLLALWPPEKQRRQLRNTWLISKRDLALLAEIVFHKDFVAPLILMTAAFGLVRTSLNFYQPIFILGGLDEVDLGAIFALGIVTAAAATYWAAPRLNKWGFNLRHAMWLFVGLAIVAGLLFNQNTQMAIYALLGFFAHQIVRTLIAPTAAASLQEAIPAGHAHRTTLVSVALFIQTICTALFVVAAGYLATYLDDPVLPLGALHLLMIIITGLTALWWKP